MLRRLAVSTASAVALFAGSAGAAIGAAPSPTRGVVLIDTNLALQNAQAAGTGIVLTKSGRVLTNNHVIAGATTIKVTVPASHRTYVASVTGYDIVDDLAVLQLQGAAGLATVTTGNSARLRIGQATTAVGNASGGGRLVVTHGRVTGLNRTISVRGDDGSFSRLSYLIETSAHLEPGDSGGPLLDAAGKVIGVDAAGSPTVSFGGDAPGYAIAINHALPIVKQIVAGTASQLVHIGPTAFVGLQLADTPEGLAVRGVVPGSPAEAAGLVVGDILTTADGTPLTSTTDLRSILFTHHPNDSLVLGYTDALGNTATVTITLADGPPQ